MSEEERKARNAYARNYYHTKYKEKTRANSRRWYLANKARAHTLSRNWKLAHPERARELTRISSRKYLPTPTRDSPLLCECCGYPDKGRVLALDHCHVTNVFRGWLCKKCNLAIGRLGDSVEGVRAALNYLLKAYA